MCMCVCMCMCMGRDIGIPAQEFINIAFYKICLRSYLITRHIPCRNCLRVLLTMLLEAESNGRKCPSARGLFAL